MYGVNFDKKLIQINLPESLSRDYLANVVLYHELGHFIDKKFGITRTIYDELLSEIQAGKHQPNEVDEINKFFPYLKDRSKIVDFINYDENNILAMHIAEYYCDLFASQYIIDWSNKYIEYITLNQSTFSSTHPATTSRVAFVDFYLKGINSYLVEKFKNVVKKVTINEISAKYRAFTSTNFENLLPVEIKHSGELHHLFHYGWEIWNGDWTKIETANNLKFSLTQEKVYEIINNLIEKSIGNYIVTTEWNKFKI